MWRNCLMLKVEKIVGKVQIERAPGALEELDQMPTIHPHDCLGLFVGGPIVHCPVFALESVFAKGKRPLLNHQPK